MHSRVPPAPEPQRPSHSYRLERELKHQVFFRFFITWLLTART